MPCWTAVCTFTYSEMRILKLHRSFFAIPLLARAPYLFPNYWRWLRIYRWKTARRAWIGQKSLRCVTFCMNTWRPQTSAHSIWVPNWLADKSFNKYKSLYYRTQELVFLGSAGPALTVYSIETVLRNRWHDIQSSRFSQGAIRLCKEIQKNYIAQLPMSGFLTLVWAVFVHLGFENFLFSGVSESVIKDS